MTPSEKLTFLPEDELVAGLRQGSKQALEYLYDKYSNALYGIILKIVEKSDVAEEVLQDTFIRVWDKIGEYDKGKGRLFTWMLNIARNLAIDKLRSKEFSQASKTNFNIQNVHIPDNSKGYVAVDGIGMDKVLDKLPPDQKQLIDMMYFQGYSQSEISEKLAIPLGTVKTKVRNAMMKLRDLLK
jgi:RNA polymerase sigma-70 factor (ECF subfamily)